MVLECFWVDYDHFSLVTMCNDPRCKSKEVFAQRRTMQILKYLNLLFDQRRAFLLAKAEIPTLDAIAIDGGHLKDACPKEREYGGCGQTRGRGRGAEEEVTRQTEDSRRRRRS